MKKTAAILLIILYLFNWGGYRVLFYWMQQQTNNRLELKLDNNEYAEGDLIELSIPLNFPYQNDWADFERTDGEIVINDTPYHFVKKKVKNNCLIIKCIPNAGKKNIMNQQEAFFKSVNDIQQDKSLTQAVAGCAKLSIFSSNDYTQQNIFRPDFYGNTLREKIYDCSDSHFETRIFFYTPEQPPETVTA